MWMSPRISGMKEIAEFDRRYFSKIYGSSYSGAEMQQLAMLMATNPALGKAMKAFSDKRSSFYRRNFNCRTYSGRLPNAIHWPIKRNR